jgi:hypothetical protein
VSSTLGGYVGFLPVSKSLLHHFTVLFYSSFTVWQQPANGWAIR